MSPMRKEKWKALNSILSNQEIGNTSNEISANRQLLDMLDLNAEILPSFLEEVILENPFIEIEYAIEKKVPQINTKHLSKGQVGLPEVSLGNATSLPVFLFEQIMLYRRTPIRDCMVKLVDYLDDRGYLPYTYQELAAQLNIDPIVVLDAMTLLKQMEPAGVSAYDLKECLMLQTEQDPMSPAIAYYLLENYFDLLIREEVDELRKVSGFGEDELEASLRYFYSLRSLPSSLFTQSSQNQLPDFTVKYEGGDFQLRYNRQYYPRLLFSQDYYNEMAAQGDADLQKYIEGHQADFSRLVADLRLREKLMERVVATLIKAQGPFLLGERDEKIPFRMKDLVDATGLSEAILNLILANKSVELMQEIKPLIDLMSITDSKAKAGLRVLNVKEKIRDLLRIDPNLSNAEVVDRLEENKIIISEALVADYRKSLN